MPDVSAEAFLDSPAPRAVVTIDGLGVGDSVLNVWRVADGKRMAVRGARRVRMNDAGFLTDWDAPLGRPVTYEVEVLTGPGGASRTVSTAVTLDTDEGWFMDPLIPNTAVSVHRPSVADGRAAFRAGAMAAFERPAEVGKFKIMGSPEPMALFGQRESASGIDLSVVTNTAAEATRLRRLLDSTSSLLVRLPASWQKTLPGVCFAAVPSVSENPVNAGLGKDLVVWAMAGDIVSAPTIKPLTGSVTFGDVAMLYTTFQDKHDSVIAAASAAGEQPTFLFDLMNPLG